MKIRVMEINSCAGSSTVHAGASYFTVNPKKSWNLRQNLNLNSLEITVNLSMWGKTKPLIWTSTKSPSAFWHRIYNGQDL